MMNTSKISYLTNSNTTVNPNYVPPASLGAAMKATYGDEENELRRFTTLIPYNHKFASNDYVIGRVQAVLKIVCSLHRPIHMGWLKRYSQPDHDFGYFFDVETDEESYEKAKTIIAQLYPGMCEFDLPYDEDQCSFAEDGATKEPLCLGRYGG